MIIASHRISFPLDSLVHLLHFFIFSFFFYYFFLEEVNIIRASLFFIHSTLSPVLPRDVTYAAASASDFGSGFFLSFFLSAAATAAAAAAGQVCAVGIFHSFLINFLFIIKFPIDIRMLLPQFYSNKLPLPKKKKKMAMMMMMKSVSKGIEPIACRETER